MSDNGEKEYQLKSSPISLSLKTNVTPVEQARNKNLF